MTPQEIQDIIGHLTYDHCPGCEGLLFKNAAGDIWCMCGWANSVREFEEIPSYDHCNLCHKHIMYGVYIKSLFVCEECTDQAKAKTDEELFAILNC